MRHSPPYCGGQGNATPLPRVHAKHGAPVALHVRMLERNEMSPPDINLERQKHRHRGPLIGMALGIVVAVGLVVFWAMRENAAPSEPAVGTMVPVPGPEVLPTEAPTTAPLPTVDQ